MRSIEIFVGGVYTLQQAAALAEVHNTAKVRRWLFGSRTATPTLIPFYGREHSGYVSFIDLVQLMAIRDIRRKKRLL